MVTNERQQSSCLFHVAVVGNEAKCRFRLKNVPGRKGVFDAELLDGATIFVGDSMGQWMLDRFNGYRWRRVAEVEGDIDRDLVAVTPEVATQQQEKTP